MTTLAAPFAIEFEAALMVLHFRNEAEGSFEASLSFTHALDDSARFAQVLDCPLTSNAPWSGISLPRTTWRLPLRRRDPILRQVLEGLANEILARLPVHTGLALEVQRALASGCRGRHAHRIGRPRIRNVGPHASAKAVRRRRVISEVAGRRAQSGGWAAPGRVDAGDRGDRLPPRVSEARRSIVRSSDVRAGHRKRFALRGRQGDGREPFKPPICEKGCRDDRRGGPLYCPPNALHDTLGFQFTNAPVGLSFHAHTCSV